MAAGGLPTNTKLNLDQFVIKDPGFDESAWGGDTVDGQVQSPFFIGIIGNNDSDEVVAENTRGNELAARPWDLETWPLGVADGTIAGVQDAEPLASTAPASPIPENQEPDAAFFSPLPESTGPNNQPRRGSYPDDFEGLGRAPRLQFKNILPANLGIEPFGMQPNSRLRDTFLENTFDRWVTPPDLESIAGFIGKSSSFSSDPLTDDTIEHYISERTEFRQDNQLQAAAFSDVNGLHTTMSWQELLDQMRLTGIDTEDETDCIFATQRYSYQPPYNPDQFVNFRVYNWVQYLQNSLAASSFEPINSVSVSALSNFAPVTIAVGRTELTISGTNAFDNFAIGTEVRVRGETFVVEEITSSSRVILDTPYQGLDGNGDAEDVPLGMELPIYYTQEQGEFISNEWTENNYWKHDGDLNAAELTLRANDTFPSGERPILELEADVVVVGSFDRNKAPQVQLFPLEYVDTDSTRIPDSIEPVEGGGFWDDFGFDIDFEISTSVLDSSAGTPGSFTVIGDQTSDFTVGRAFTIISSSSQDSSYTVSASSAFNASSNTTNIPVGSAAAFSGTADGLILSVSSLNLNWDDEGNQTGFVQGTIPQFILPILEYQIAEVNVDGTPTENDPFLRFRAQKVILDSEVFVFRNNLVDQQFDDFPRDGRLLSYATQISDSDHTMRNMWRITLPGEVAPARNGEGEFNIAENFQINIEKENPPRFTGDLLNRHFTDILRSQATAGGDEFRDGRDWRLHEDRFLGRGGAIFEYEHELDWFVSLFLQPDSDPSVVIDFARSEHIRRNDSIKGIIERLANNLADKSQVVTQTTFRQLVFQEFQDFLNGIVPNPFFDSTGGLPNFIATPAHFGLILAVEPCFIYDHITQQLAYRGVLGEITELPFGTDQPTTLDLIYNDIQHFIFESIPVQFRTVTSLNTERQSEFDILNFEVFSGDGTTGTFRLSFEPEKIEFLTVTVDPVSYNYTTATVLMASAVVSDTYSLAINDKVLAIEASAGDTVQDLATKFVAEKTDQTIIAVDTVEKTVTVTGDQSHIFFSGQTIEIFGSANAGLQEIANVLASAVTDIKLNVPTLSASIGGVIDAWPELVLFTDNDQLKIETDLIRNLASSFTLSIVDTGVTESIVPPIISASDLPGASAIIANSAITTTASNMSVLETPNPVGGTLKTVFDDYSLRLNRIDLAFARDETPASGLNNIAIVNLGFAQKLDEELPPSTQFTVVSGSLLFNIENYIFDSDDDETLVRCYPRSVLLREEEKKFFDFLRRRSGVFNDSFADPFQNEEDDSDPFTWNYRDTSNNIPAFWPQIYQTFFLTSGPEFEPWILQGYTEKPGFWDMDFPPNASGLYPFRDMWENIQNGVVQPGRTGIGELDGGVKTPSSQLPINFDTGALLPPFSDDLLNPSLFDTIPPGRFDDFIFGDCYVAEQDWRNSLDFRWDTVEIGYRLKPIDFISLTWDAERLREWFDSYTYDRATGRKTTHEEMIFFGEQEKLIETEPNFFEFSFCGNGSTVDFTGTAFVFSDIEFLEGNGRQEVFTLERLHADGDFSLVDEEGRGVLSEGIVVASTVVGGDYGFPSANTIQFDIAPGLGVAFIGPEWDCSLTDFEASITTVMVPASATASSFLDHFPAGTFFISGSNTGAAGSVFVDQWNFGACPLSIGADEGALIFRDGVLLASALYNIVNSSNIEVTASAGQTIDIRIGAFVVACNVQDDLIAGIIGASTDAGKGVDFDVISSTGNDDTYTVGPPDSVFNASAATTVIPVLQTIPSVVADGAIQFTNCAVEYGWDVIGWDTKFVGDPIQVRVKQGTPVGDLTFDPNDTIEAYVDNAQISSANFTVNNATQTITTGSAPASFSILRFLIFNPASIREKDELFCGPKIINGVNQWYTQFYRSRSKSVAPGSLYDLFWKNWDPRIIYRTDHMVNADSVIVQTLAQTKLGRGVDFFSEIDRSIGIRDFHVDSFRVDIVEKTETSFDNDGLAPTSTIFEVNNFDERRGFVTTAIAREDAVFLFTASALTASQITAGETVTFSGLDNLGNLLAFRNRDEISLAIDGTLFDSLVNVREQEISLTTSGLLALSASGSEIRILDEPPQRVEFSQTSTEDRIIDELLVSNIDLNTFAKGTVSPTGYVKLLEFEVDEFGDLDTQDVLLPQRFTGTQELYTFLVEYERYLLEQGAVFDSVDSEVGTFRDWDRERRKLAVFVDRQEIFINDPTNRPSALTLNPTETNARLGTIEDFVAPIESDADNFSKKEQALLDINGFLIGPKQSQVFRGDAVTEAEIIPGAVTRIFLADGVSFTPQFVQGLNPRSQGKIVLDGEIWFNVRDNTFNSYVFVTDEFIPSEDATNRDLQAVIQELNIFTVHWVVDSYEHIVRFNNDADSGREIYEPLTGDIIPRLYICMERGRQRSGRPNLGGFVLNRDEGDNLILLSNIERQVQGLRDIFDPYRVPLDNRFDEAIINLLGIREQPFLDNLIGAGSRRTQIGFNQGFMQQKGAKDNVDAYLKAFRNLTTFDLFELWAYRVGQFGSDPGNDFVTVFLTEREGARTILGLHFTDLSGLEPADPELVEVLESDPDKYQLELDQNTTFDEQRFWFPAEDETSVFAKWEVDFVQSRKEEGNSNFVGISQGFTGFTASSSGSSSTILAGDPLEAEVFDKAYDDSTTTTIVASSVSILTSTINAAGSTIDVDYPHFGMDFGTDGPNAFDENIRVAAFTIFQDSGTAVDRVQVQYTNEINSSGIPVEWIIIAEELPVGAPDDTRVEGRKITLPFHDVSARFWRLIPLGLAATDDWKIVQLEAHKYRPKAKYDMIGKPRAFNGKTGATVAAFYPWDPAEGIHPPQAEKWIDHQIDSDPALYTDDTTGSGRLDIDDAWGSEHVGETWWDLGQWGTIDYKDERRFESASRRAALWGRLEAGKRVVVYEWVRSPVKPSGWTELVLQTQEDNPERFGKSEFPDGEPRNINQFTTDIVTDSNGEQEIFFYFWVTNCKRRSFNKQGVLRTLTLTQIAEGLEDPNTLTDLHYYLVDSFKSPGDSTSEDGWDTIGWDVAPWDVAIVALPDRFTKWFGNRGDLVYTNDNIQLQFDRKFLLTGKLQPDELLSVRHEEWELIREQNNELPPEALWDQIVDTATNDSCLIGTGNDVNEANQISGAECFMDRTELLRILNKRIPEIKPDFFPEGWEAASPAGDGEPSWELDTPWGGVGETTAFDPDDDSADRDLSLATEPLQIFFDPSTAEGKESITALLARDSDLSFWNQATADQVSILFFEILESSFAGNKERDDLFKTSWVSYDVDKELVQDTEFRDFTQPIDLVLEFLEEAKPFHTKINEELSRINLTVSENLIVCINSSCAVSFTGFAAAPAATMALEDDITLSMTDAFDPLNVGSSAAETIDVDLTEELRIDVVHANPIINLLVGSAVGPGASGFTVWNFSSALPTGATGDIGALNLTGSAQQMSGIIVDGATTVPRVGSAITVTDSSNVEIKNVHASVGAAVVLQVTTACSVFYSMYMIHNGGTWPNSFQTIGGSVFVPGYRIGGSVVGAPFAGSHIGSGSAFSDVWTFPVGAVSVSNLELFVDGVHVAPVYASIVNYEFLSPSTIEIDASAGQTLEYRSGNMILAQLIPASALASEDWFRWDDESFASNAAEYHVDGIGQFTTSSIRSGATFVRASAFPTSSFPRWTSASQVP